MISKLDKNAKRKARHYRMRRHIIGTPARPRLCVYRSLNHIYAQVIDDEIGATLAAASSSVRSLQSALSIRAFRRSYSTAAVISTPVV